LTSKASSNAFWLRKVPLARNCRGMRIDLEAFDAGRSRTLSRQNLRKIE